MEKRLVLDVSKWNGDIDLAAWKKHNLWGVIVKAGGYEYIKSDGRFEQYKDSKFETNYKKAKDAGLHVGAYYYDASTNAAQAKSDAKHFLTIINGKSLDMPCYMDVEEAEQFKLTKRRLTDVIKAFCDAVNAGKFNAGLYTGGSAWVNNMYADELRKYAIWIAAWGKNWPEYAGEIGMWQQGSMSCATGDIAYGWKDGYVDCDWCIVDYPAATTGTKEGVVVAKTKLTVGERSAQCAEYIANTNTHGYSQPNRMGWGSETVKFSDSTTFTIHRGDYDCSEMARVCANAGLGYNAIGYMWSGDADTKLKGAGFKRMAFSTSAVRRGDILWTKGHMGIALGGGKQADAHGDEVGGITGPRQGDQTGHEIEVRSLRTTWTYIYRYAGSSGDKATTTLAPGYRKDASRAGTYRCTVNGLNIRRSPGRSGKAVGHYDKGETVKLEGYWWSVDGFVWGTYVGGSGNRNYVAVGRDTGKIEPDDYLVKA